MLSEHGCDSVHLCDLIDEFFQVLNVGIGCVLRINLRRVQNNNLNSIRSQRLQCARYTTRLIKCLASVSNAALLVKDFCNDIYIFLSPININCPTTKNSFPKALHSKLLVEDMTHIQNCQSLSMELITFRIFSACK